MVSGTRVGKMSMIENVSRRGFIGGIGALFIAAPAIVRAASIMPVKAMPAVDVLIDAQAMRVTDWVPPMTVWSRWVFMDGAWRNIGLRKEPSMFDPPVPRELIYRRPPTFLTRRVVG